MILDSPVLKELKEKLTSPDEEVGAEACTALGLLGGFMAGDILIEAFYEGSQSVKEKAGQTLVRLANETVIEKLIALFREENVSVRNRAMEAVSQIGSDAVPLLKVSLQDEDSDVRIFSANVLGVIGDNSATDALISSLLEDDNENVRFASAEALGLIGDRRAIAPLIQAFNADEWLHHPAVEALGRIGAEEALDLLIDVMKDDWLRYPGLEALGNIGSPGTVDRIIDQLKDDNEMVVQAAVCALAKIERKQATGIFEKIRGMNIQEKLTSALSSPDTQTRVSAITAIGWVGEAELLPRLVRELESRDEGVFRAAFEAVKLIGISNRSALIDVFLQSGAENRGVLAEIMGEIGSKEFADALVKALSADDSNVRIASVVSLGRIGDARSAEPLLPCMSDPDGDVRKAAATALGHLKAAEAIRGLTSMLEDPYQDVREAAAESLGRMGVSGIGTHLIPLLKHERGEVRQAAVKALGLIDDRLPDAYILDALQDSDCGVRRLPCKILGERRVQKALSPLAGMLADDDWQVRKLAAEALGSLRNDRAVEHLVASLADENLWVRYSAVDSLGRIKSTAAMGPLLSALENDADPVRIAASFESGHSMHTTSIDEALAGRSGMTVCQDYRGVDVLSVYTPLQVKGLNWAALAEKDVSEAFGPARALRNMLLTVTGIFSAFFVSVGVVYSRRIYKPVEQLSSVARVLAGGNLVQTVEIKRRDEIGKL